MSVTYKEYIQYLKALPKIYLQHVSQFDQKVKSCPPPLPIFYFVGTQDIGEQVWLRSVSW